MYVFKFPFPLIWLLWKIPGINLSLIILWAIFLIIKLFNLEYSKCLSAGNYVHFLEMSGIIPRVPLREARLLFQFFLFPSSLYIFFSFMMKFLTSLRIYGLSLNWSISYLPKFLINSLIKHLATLVFLPKSFSFLLKIFLNFLRSIVEWVREFW